VVNGTQTLADRTSEDVVTRVRSIAARVPDPEIPVISIDDLGVLRDVTVSDDGHVDVTLTPTYSGCPAMDEISADVRSELLAEGFENVSVRLVLSPAWTTEMITPRGRQALQDFGIAPPGPPQPGGTVLLQIGRKPPTPACPQCGSQNTSEISRFGSTSCKALYRCLACQEPFDYFKAL
jgi:ring-1,2-phenylacetyl-CoA epoxidase subunit PaaD